MGRCRHLRVFGSYYYSRLEVTKKEIMKNINKLAKLLMISTYITTPLTIYAQGDMLFIPNIKSNFISIHKIQTLPSINIELPKHSNLEDSSIIEFSSPLDNNVNTTMKTSDEEQRNTITIEERLKEIEDMIREQEGVQPASPEAKRPEDLQNTHPDLFTGNSSNFDILEFPNSNSTFDILGWDTETRTAQVRDWQSNPENKGLQPHVARFKEEVAAMYGITSFSLYRPGDPQDHGKGLAVDFMVPIGSDVGDKIASYALTQMYNGSEKISYVIWEQHIWGDWSTGWEPMEDRGSITQNHYDHVHVSFHP